MQVFEMSRRSKGNVRCDVCGNGIPKGERYRFKRRKESPQSSYEEQVVCEDCDLFGFNDNPMLRQLERIGLA